MTELVVFDKAVCENYGEKQQAQTTEKLADSTRQNGDVKCPGDQLSTFNVTRQVSDDGTNSLTRFPNGVKSDRGGVAVGIEPPPGGSIDTDKSGNTILLDSSKKVVARLDRDDKELHVYTKHGEFIEAKDGKITYKPADKVTDLQSLHKAGVVDQSKYEDYGMSKGGTITRFPNGIEYDSKSNRVIIPADHPNFYEQKNEDDKGNVTKRTGYDGNGKILYTWDKDGLHIPTADGVLTKMNNGQIKFEPNQPKSLPKVTIEGDGKETRKPEPKKKGDPLGEECKDSWDPLCGLDLGEF